jgi:hypothetical protein
MFYFGVSYFLERRDVMAEIEVADIYAGTKSSNSGTQPAFRLFRRAFTIAPIAFGLDQLSGFLHGWHQNVGPWVSDVLPGAGAVQSMLAVGIVEMVAGLALTVLPHFFGGRAQAFIDPVVNLATDALTRLLS